MFSFSKLKASQSIVSLLNAKEALHVPSYSDCDAFLTIPVG
jgi:hypothetical protein